MTHYYDKTQLSPLIIKKITIKLSSDTFYLNTAPGLFSKGELDLGTKLLIEDCELPKQGKILDLGCGYGVVGIAIKRRHPKLNMTFSDVNERAVLITEKNLKEHHITATVITSNLFENIEGTFTTILSNPPYAAGRELCYQLIEESYEHLIKQGSLQIVARHNKGGAMLGKKIKEVFGNMNERSKKSGFRIYQGIKEA